ncbi:right-handed parallel beta-helix repeat-containing protein [bacterium]|nr:right-handed parallel beta-helix repeat-containing protein [bacterium]
MRTRRYVFALVGFVAVTGSMAMAATYRVPADYQTIQEALDVSALGDTVLVAPGTYSEYSLYANGALIGRPPDGVVLLGEEGPWATVIDLAPLDGAAAWSIAFSAGGHTSGQTVIDGFRVINMPAHSVGVSVGFSEEVEVRNCWFEVADGANVDYRQGVSGYHSDLRVTDCTFLRCQNPGGGAGVNNQLGEVLVEGCMFVECRHGSALAAANGDFNDPPGALEVRSCVFRRCVTRTGGGGIHTDQRGGVLIDHCIFEDMEAIGTGGAAIVVRGGGLRTISNCIFRSMNLSDGINCIYAQSGLVTLTGNTFVDLHQEPATPPQAVVLGTASVGPVVFENNIVAHTSGGEVLEVPAGSTTSCNVFWDNADGIGLDLDPSDRIVDPQFCDPDNGDYTLMATSPCLPALSLGCDLIGALGQGCGTVSLTPESWGRIKSGFRTGEEE